MPELRPARHPVRPDLPSGDFDLVLFAYVASPDSPGATVGPLRLRTASQQLRRVLPAARHARPRPGRADPRTPGSARVLNRADAQLAKDVPVIPLFQNPNVDRLSDDDPERRLSVTARPLWNVEDWWLAALALAAAIAVSLLAVSGAGGAGVQTPKRGGTVVFGHVAPSRRVSIRSSCAVALDLSAVGTSSRPAFAVASRSPRCEATDLVSSVDVTTDAALHAHVPHPPGGRWSDGVPVTARDFVFTHDAIRKLPDGSGSPTARHPRRVRAVSAVDAKTVRVVLRSRFAGWRGLFTHVLPLARPPRRGLLDRLERRDPQSRRRAGRSGAARSSSRAGSAGEQITFVRNPRYWRTHTRLPRPARRPLRRQCRGGTEPAEWLRTGRARLSLRSALHHRRAGSGDSRRSAGSVLLAGRTSWEHLDIRIGRRGAPGARGKRVRQALAYGIDRVAIARQLFGEFDAALPAERQRRVPRQPRAPLPAALEPGIATGRRRREGCSSGRAAGRARTASTRATDGGS